ncbi:MAG: xanthine dehydrogenase small subunit [Rubrivivax sp.]|nr:xanthine dehydrogenase small subunit [Rubrivivax sp.]
MSSDIYAVRFVLDGEIHHARGERRTTTVLDYLREKLHRTGTKEGCAEGDCGACVVLVGQPDASGTRVDWKPVNSCLQMLPTLDGKAIKTVESLKRADGTLHPVQQAMVDCHGSQCGFCTPGIVMSLAALAEHNGQPTRVQITDALSGNLCRCTGYRPIVDAAVQACGAPAAARSLQDERTLALLKEIARPTQPTYNLEGELVVQPVVRTRKGSEFVSPATLAELSAYLAENPEATLLAGSTEFGLAVNKRHERPATIAYVGGVAELLRIDETPAHWRIGAAVPLDRVMSAVARELPDFAEVLRRFGSPPIRSTATLGGNIANGSPIGDSMPCLMALGATLLLRRRGPKGKDETRRVPLEGFYTGLKRTVLQRGEYIEAVELPRLQGRLFKAHKISKRVEQDISATCAALSWRDDGGRLKDVRLAYNGLTPYPARAPKIEAVLEGRRPAEVTAQALDEAIAQSFTPRDGLRATWAYRALVARNLVLRFVQPELAEA